VLTKLFLRALTPQSRLERLSHRHGGFALDAGQKNRIDCPVPRKSLATADRFPHSIALKYKIIRRNSHTAGSKFLRTSSDRDATSSQSSRPLCSFSANQSSRVRYGVTTKPAAFRTYTQSVDRLAFRAVPVRRPRCRCRWSLCRRDWNERAAQFAFPLRSGVAKTIGRLQTALHRVSVEVTFPVADGDLSPVHGAFGGRRGPCSSTSVPSHFKERHPLPNLRFARQEQFPLGIAERVLLRIARSRSGKLRSNPS